MVSTTSPGTRVIPLARMWRGVSWVGSATTYPGNQRAGSQVSICGGPPRAGCPLPGTGPRRRRGLRSSRRVTPAGADQVVDAYDHGERDEADRRDHGVAEGGRVAGRRRAGQGREEDGTDHRLADGKPDPLPGLQHATGSAPHD